MLIDLLPFLFQLDKFLLPVLIVAVGLIIYHKKRNRLLDYALAVILTSGLSEMIKYVINKPRPISDFLFEGSSFPSTHSATAACVVFFYLLVVHNAPSTIKGIGEAVKKNLVTSEGVKTIIIVLLGLLVCWLRVVLKAHYWTDVFAGITLGYIISLAFMFYDISGRRVK